MGVNPSQAKTFPFIQTNKFATYMVIWVTDRKTSGISRNRGLCLSRMVGGLLLYGGMCASIYYKV